MIKLLVDSASDISQAEAEQMGITMIAMEINFADAHYFDGLDLTAKDFYNKLVESAEIPKTSQINSFRFTEKFQELTKDGDEVLCITMSSKLSGTCNSARDAAKKFKDQIQVVDSLNVSVGERILIEYARKLIDKGLTLSQIAAELNEKKKQVRLVALLDTLKYLQKGGRISKITALTGTILNVKPVIAIVDGEVKVIGKALGSKKGNNLLNQLIEKNGGIDFTMPYATGYSGLTDALLQKYLIDSAVLWQGRTENVPVYYIGCTIGTHAGPGTIGVAFFSNN